MTIKNEIYEDEHFFDDPQAAKLLKEVMTHPNWGEREIQQAKRATETEKIEPWVSPLNHLQNTWHTIERTWHNLQMQYHTGYKKSFQEAIEKIKNTEVIPTKRGVNTGFSMPTIALKESKNKTKVRMSKMKLDALPELKMELERVRIRTLRERKKSLEDQIKEKQKAIKLLEKFLQTKAIFDQEEEKLKIVRVDYDLVRDEYQKEKKKTLQKKVLTLGADITQVEETLRLKRLELESVTDAMHTSSLLQKSELYTEKTRDEWQQSVEQHQTELEKILSAITLK